MDFKTVIDKLHEMETEKLIKDNPGTIVSFAFEKKTAQILSLVYNMIALTGGKTEGLAGFGKDGQALSIEIEKKEKDKKSSEKIIAAKGGDGDSGEGTGTDN
jgi:hypothetical protein